jgi:hypothetical protein
VIKQADIAKVTVVWDEGQPQNTPPFRNPSWNPWLVSVGELRLVADILKPLNGGGMRPVKAL